MGLLFLFSMSWRESLASRKVFLRGVVLGALSMLVMACGGRSAPTEAAENGCEASAVVAKYGVAPVQRRPVYEEFILPGEIVALSSETVPLMSLSDGVVEEVYVKLGESVEVGRPLLSLRSPQLFAWQARQEALRGLLQAARLKATTLDSLLRSGLASRSELAQAQAELTSLIAESLEVASNLRTYEYKDGRFFLRAPRSGTIIQLAVRNGMPIQAGDTLLILSNLAKVRAHIYFYADQAAVIRAGLPVRLRLVGFSQEPIQTTIAGLYPTLDPTERTGTAYIDLPNPHRTLYPGLYLQAVITKPEADSAVFVPMKAIVFSANTHYALVWKGACNWEVQPLVVRKAIREGFFCDNLKPGDSIATENVLLLFQKLTQRL